MHIMRNELKSGINRLSRAIVWIEWSGVSAKAPGGNAARFVLCAVVSWVQDGLIPSGEPDSSTPERGAGVPFWEKPVTTTDGPSSKNYAESPNLHSA